MQLISTTNWELVTGGMAEVMSGSKNVHQRNWDFTRLSLLSVFRYIRA
ncbi:MAG: hypothetical protein AAGI38_08525 [Bacteroidota bacterium]